MPNGSDGGIDGTVVDGGGGKGVEFVGGGVDVDVTVTVAVPVKPAACAATVAVPAANPLTTPVLVTLAIDEPFATLHVNDAATG